jgi:phage baseplate assembly protein W
MARHDYDFPFRIDAGSQRGGEAPTYADHVDQMLRQLLLTSPGERTCLPEFGCGLRRLLFAPQSDALTATVQIQVRQAIERWLSDQVQLQKVEVVSGATDPTSGLDVGELRVTVSYVVVDQLAPRQMELVVR